MKVKILHCTLLFLAGFAVFPVFKLRAQQDEIKARVDSMYSELVNTPNSEKKVDNLIKLFKDGGKRKYVNYAIIDNAIRIGQELEYIEGLGKAYYYKGLRYRYDYDYYKAIKNQTIAYTYLQKTTDTLITIKCLNSLGIGYRKVNIVNKSFDYYFEAYLLAEKFKYTSSMAVALNGIGNLFIDTKKYNEALYYFRKALDLELANDNKTGIEYDYANIGEVYMFLGNYDSAHYYTQKALELSKNNGKENSHVYELSLFGKIYQKQGKYKFSNACYEEALEIFKKIRNKRYLANTYINIGNNKIAMNKMDEGIRDIKTGLEIALEIGSKENIMEGYNNLTACYAKAGMYKEALEAHIKAENIEDSILNESSLKALFDSRVAYESHEKDEEISRLMIAKSEEHELAKRNLKKAVYISIAGLLVLGILAFLFWLHKKNTRLEIEALNSKLQTYILQKNSESSKKTSITEQIASFDLSAREAEVLLLIVQGFTNDEIAEKLFISKNTVKYHSKNIYSKLDVKNRIQIIKKLT